jgi:hypothetical protein
VKLFDGDERAQALFIVAGVALHAIVSNGAVHSAGSAQHINMAFDLAESFIAEAERRSNGTP